MGYINAALLNDEPLSIESGGRMTLRYRLIVHANRWDAERLQAAQASFSRSVVPRKE
jgi:hypothetical protein